MIITGNGQTNTAGFFSLIDLREGEGPAKQGVVRVRKGSERGE